MSTSDNTATLDPFEARLRADLHRLADYAPTSVDLTVDSAATITANTAGDESPHRGRRVASIGAIVAVLAGGAGLTISGLQSASDPGGAATPDEAIQKFADAFANEDLLGMADVTVPEEAKALRAAADDAVAQAKRLDLVSQSFQLNGISGLDVSIDGLTLTDRPIDDQLVAVTSTGGTMSLALDPNALEVGDRTAGGFYDVAPESETVDLAADPITLVAQRRGDDWYVSVGMSVAEVIVMSTGEPTPVGLGIVPEGSSSPEAAANAFYGRLANFDLTGAAALVAPGEGDVFRRYAGLWQPAVLPAVESAKADGNGFAITTPIEYSRVVDSDGRVILKPVTYGFDFTSAEYEYISTPVEVDPNLETMVSDESKGGMYLLPAGTPIPATLDDPIFDTVEFYSWEDEAAMAELDGSGEEYVERNYVWSNTDGTIELPTEDVQGDLIGTTTTHVEAADGCTTITLPPDAGGPNDAFDPVSMEMSGMEKVGDNSYRMCGSSEGLLGSFAFGFLVGTPLAELPSIVVTDNGGEWFVSPIGTIAESLIGGLRDAPDGANVVDIPLMAMAQSLMTRAQFNASINAEDGIGDVPECAAITEDGPDGTRVLIADPDVDALRACLDNMWSGYDDSSVEMDSIDESAPASEVTGG